MATTPFHASLSGIPIAPTTVVQDTPEARLIWNTWIERPMTPNRAEPAIRPDMAYILRVHLAVFPYGTGTVGFGASRISQTAATAVKKWVEYFDSTVPTIPIDALLLTDGLIFETPSDSDARRNLTIHLSRIRNLDSLSRPDAPLQELARGRDDFVLGDASFPVRTRARFPNGEQRGRVAVSLWDPDSRRPIDELGIGVCIVGKCQGVKNEEYGFVGLDALRGKASTVPAAAIHVVEFGNTVRGVLRHKGSSEYFTWSLGKSFRELRDSMQNELATIYNSTQEQRESTGGGLFEMLFATDDQSDAARREFLDLVTTCVSPTPFASDEMLAIFFRVASASSNEPLLWPLALMTVIQSKRGADPATPCPLDTATAPVSRPRYREGDVITLGYHFRIETPLTIQSYESPDECIQDWVVVGPRHLGTTAAALSRLSNYIEPSDDFTHLSLRVDDSAAEIIDDMHAFRTFIYGVNSRVIPETEKATMMSIVSHHNQSSVYFDLGDLAITGGQFRRKFQAPSIALLNGCETGEPGASGLLKALNVNGVHAAIVTISGVEPELAGDFLSCFVEQLNGAPASGLPLGVLHTRALRCIQGRGSYNSKVLYYGLLGNSGLRVCKPNSAH